MLQAGAIPALHHRCLGPAVVPCQLHGALPSARLATRRTPPRTQPVFDRVVRSHVVVRAHHGEVSTAPPGAAASSTTATESYTQQVVSECSPEPPQSLFDDQLAHLIDPRAQLGEDFEEVAKQLPLIKAELGDQQQLLIACNQFLEDMAGRHLNLLLQQQAAQRSKGAPADTTAGPDATEQSLQLQQVSAQLLQQQQEVEELRAQGAELRKQLRIVTMEREELKQQVPQQEDAGDSAKQLQEALQALSDLQGQLTAAQQQHSEALGSKEQLQQELEAAHAAAEAAKATALAATGSVSAATHAQLQEATAKAASLEAQLAASQQHSRAVTESVAVLTQQLEEAQAQAKRLIGMNKQLVQHAEVLGSNFQQQAALVAALKEDKAVMAAELSRIYAMLQGMQGAQQRQQNLQQQLLQLIALQQGHSTTEPVDHLVTVAATTTEDDGSAGGSSSGSAAGETPDAQGAASGEDATANNSRDDAPTNPLMKALSGAVLGAALPLVGQFLR